MNTDNERAAMFAADVAFTKALKKQFPTLRHLGDVRYDHARHNAETKAAGDAYRSAVDAFHGAAARSRLPRWAGDRG